MYSFAIIGFIAGFFLGKMILINTLSKEEISEETFFSGIMLSVIIGICMATVFYKVQATNKINIEKEKECYEWKIKN